MSLWGNSPWLPGSKATVNTFLMTVWDNITTGNSSGQGEPSHLLTERWDSLSTPDYSELTMTM